MRRNSSFRIFLFGFFLMIFSNTIAGTFKNASSVTSKKIKSIILIDLQKNDISKQTTPITKEEEPIKKTHSMKTEELAHIHYFHKERVKKIRRHHKKFWILSKVLLILCHLVLLICAYQHLLHE